MQIKAKCHHSVTTRLLLWCRVLICNLLAGGGLAPQKECPMGRTSMVRARGRAAVLTAGITLLTFAAHSASLTVSETGSTLILPLFKAWVAGYAKVDPDLSMTVGATGSEA